MRVRMFVSVLSLLAVTGGAETFIYPVLADPPAYDARATAEWRAQRERGLRAEDGWLSVVELAFLQPGANDIGADRTNDVLLPAGAPPVVGRLIVDGTRVRFEPAAGVDVRLKNQPVTAPREIGPGDRLQVGRVTFHVHESGARIGIRVRDPQSPLLRDFRGLKWFAIDKEWNLAGRFEAYSAPRPVTVPNVLGDLEQFQSPGDVVLTIAGETVRLQAISSGRRLWFIFSDGTSNRESYRIRFLYADAPAEDGSVTLDFNRAYNPPCAVNPYTTCPLPPKNNRLSVPIRAGERSTAH